MATLFVNLIVFYVTTFSFTAALTDEHRDFVVKLHNELRTNMARGNLRNSYGTFPQASNMQKLVYSLELEKKAQPWSKNCELKHSAMEDYGENIGYTSYLDDEKEIINDTINTWWNEYKDTPIGKISNFGMTVNKMISHFTIMAWAQVNEVGCGFTRCNTPIKEKYVVCNYRPKGNIGQEVYKTGRHCSACDGGCSENGVLCKPTAEIKHRQPENKHPQPKNKRSQPDNARDQQEMNPRQHENEHPQPKNKRSQHDNAQDQKEMNPRQHENEWSQRENALIRQANTRLKHTMKKHRQEMENIQQANARLQQENARLQQDIVEYRQEMKKRQREYEQRRKDMEFRQQNNAQPQPGNARSQQDISKNRQRLQCDCY